MDSQKFFWFFWFGLNDNLNDDFIQIGKQDWSSLKAKVTSVKFSPEDEGDSRMRPYTAGGAVRAR